MIEIASGVFDTEVYSIEESLLVAAVVDASRDTQRGGGYGYGNSVVEWYNSSSHLTTSFSLKICRRAHYASNTLSIASWIR